MMFMTKGIKIEQCNHCKLKRSEEPRDEISRIILNVMAIKGPQKVSSLIKEVQRDTTTG